ncbi:hypothetical protein BJV82DRAFT_669460 [Fennellomyces sp. T-0311]|nr:hypothetical protein BJV82DRAFT_669460 [Fennellomyces sp. T-0311]
MLSDSPLGNVECPVCQSDLSSLRSSYQRQEHVERCLTASDQPTTIRQDNDFDYCIFCGKCITHLVRKDVHFSQCLDDLASEERAQRDASFAGQAMPFLHDLDICPCCHEFSPMQGRPIRQKVIHIKQCIRRRGMTMPQLLQKMQWIQWDYTPEQKRPVKPPPIQQRKIPQMVVQATVAADDDDDDFSSTVIVHKRALPTLTKRQRQAQDKMDDELQLALAMSRSENNNKRVKLDPNATCIVPIHDSQKLAHQALNLLLSRQEPACCLETEPLPPSRIGGRYPWSLWELASLSTSPESQVFVSPFILELKSSTGTG